MPRIEAMMRPASELSYRSRINRVAAFVAANLAGTLDGASLAREVALSRFHFQRVFRRMTGLTPAEYVEFARLGRAIAHLRQGGQQVGRIAAEVGYETGASLAKALRRRFGVAPTGLRRPEPGPPGPRSLDVSAFQRPRCDTRLCARYLELPPQSLLCTPVRGMISRGLAAVHDQAQVRLVTEAGRLGLLERLAGDSLLIPAGPVGPDDPTFSILVGFLLQGPPPALPALVQVHAFIQVLAPRMASELQAAMAAWLPQVVLRDPLEFAGWLAAEQAGLPHATVDWGIHIPTHQIVQAALVALGARFGLADPVRAAQTLDRYLVLGAMPPHGLRHPGHHLQPFPGDLRDHPRGPEPGTGGGRGDPGP
jgi:AraC family transcriptional regulator